MAGEHSQRIVNLGMRGSRAWPRCSATNPPGPRAALQLRGQAKNRQVTDARLALVTAGGGPGGGANIYAKERP